MEAIHRSESSQKQSGVEKFKGKEGEEVESASGDTNFKALMTIGRDLVEQAGKLDPVIGRDEEIRLIVRILSCRRKNNLVLIGEPGVGKKAIVKGLAQRIARGDVPSYLADVRLIALDMGTLVIGMKYMREFEERLKAVLKEVEDAANKVILFINEIHLVFGAGRTKGSMDAADLLMSMIAMRQLRCIGATTPEYKKYVEKDAAFKRRFQQIYVDEPSIEDTVSILRGLKERYEGYHGVRIQDRALVVAAQLSAKYIIGRDWNKKAISHLPDKAIDLVDQGCADVRAQLDSQPEEIDDLETRRIHLEVEMYALENGKHTLNKFRLTDIRKELDDLKDKLQTLVMRYRKEKKIIDEIRKLKQKREELTLFALQKVKVECREDLARAADLRYGDLQEIDAMIAQLEREADDENLMLTDIVGPDHIVELVSHWTGYSLTSLFHYIEQKSDSVTVGDNAGPFLKRMRTDEEYEYEYESEDEYEY